MEQSLFSRVNLVHALSGSTGGIIAISLFYPLNIARTRLQIDESIHEHRPMKVIFKIAEEEGFMALYQGWWSSIVSIGASNFVYFYVYNTMKLIYAKIYKGRTLGAGVNLLLASAAGVLNVLVTTPLWVAGTRLTVQGKKRMLSNKFYNGVWDALRTIAKEEGLGALWNGVLPSIVLVSNPAIQFSTYERLKIFMTVVSKKRGSSISSLEYFIMGAMAKAVATVLTYPLQIAQSRLRTDKEERYKGTIDLLRKIYAIGGFVAWFKGIEAKLWQTVLTAAFQFTAYETLHQFLIRLLIRKTK